MIDPDSDRGNLCIGIIPANPNARVFLDTVTLNPPLQEGMDQDFL
jgi:hypothetical protein